MWFNSLLRQRKRRAERQNKESVNQSWLAFRFFDVRFLGSRFVVFQRLLSWPANPVTSNVRAYTRTAAMASGARSLLRGCLVYFLVGFGGAGILIALVYFLSRHEKLAEFTLPKGRMVFIYAEADFHYEPPGYIYCEITDNGKVVVPARRFMGIGPERKPSGTFRVARSQNQQLMAITLDGDVQFLYDFGNRRCWPALYTTTDTENYGFATEALGVFRGEGKALRCSRIRDYEIRKKRRAADARP